VDVAGAEAVKSKLLDLEFAGGLQGSTSNSEVHWQAGEASLHDNYSKQNRHVKYCNSRLAG
jgi:hypothetical protein